MNAKYMLIVAVMAIMFVGATAFTTGNAFAKYGSQAISQANKCGNDKMPIYVFCRNTDSQVQGEGNAVALDGVQQGKDFKDKKDWGHDADGGGYDNGDSGGYDDAAAPGTEATTGMNEHSNDNGDSGGYDNGDSGAAAPDSGAAAPDSGAGDQNAAAPPADQDANIAPPADQNAAAPPADQNANPLVW